MNAVEQQREIQRILLALDASPNSLAALEAAAELAARLHAELAGLFVEDIDLLNVAGLPFARQIGLFAAGDRRLNTRQLEHQLRLQAEKARQVLAATAERARVRWSFRIARGQVVTEVASAAADTDLLIMGRVGWSPGQWKRLGNTAQNLLSRTPCLAMVLRQGMRFEMPVAVLYDGTPTSSRVLAVALQLAQGKSGLLNVILLAPEVSAAYRLQLQVEKWLGQADVKFQFQAMIERTDEQLVRQLATLDRGLLVLPGEGSLFSARALQKVLDQVTCPVLVVRPRGD